MPKGGLKFAGAQYLKEFKKKYCSPPLPPVLLCHTQQRWSIIRVLRSARHLQTPSLCLRYSARPPLPFERPTSLVTRRCDGNGGLPIMLPL